MFTICYAGPRSLPARPRDILASIAQQPIRPCFMDRLPGSDRAPSRSDGRHWSLGSKLARTQSVYPRGGRLFFESGQSSVANNAQAYSQETTGHGQRTPVSHSGFVIFSSVPSVAPWLIFSHVANSGVLKPTARSVNVAFAKKKTAAAGHRS
jgi:hypothetical protein